MYVFCENSLGHETSSHHAELFLNIIISVRRQTISQAKHATSMLARFHDNLINNVCSCQWQLWNPILPVAVGSETNWRMELRSTRIITGIFLSILSKLFRMLLVNGKQLTLYSYLNIFQTEFASVSAYFRSQHTYTHCNIFAQWFTCFLALHLLRQFKIHLLFICPALTCCHPPLVYLRN